MALKKWVLIFTVCMGAWGGLFAQGAPEDMAVLFVRQDFLKLGKKEAYDSLRKSWFQDFTRFAAKGNYVPPILGIDDVNGPLHVCMIFLPSFGGIDDYFQSKENFRKSTPQAQWRDRSMAITSCLNYQINSLHAAMPDCSYYMSGFEGSMYNVPYMHYYVFTLVNNSDAAFEEHLRKMVVDQKQKKSSVYWRTWKVMFGGSVPKYIVCVFAKSDAMLKAALGNLNFIDTDTKPLIVRHREGHGMIRKDLSYIQGQ